MGRRLAWTVLVRFSPLVVAFACGASLIPTVAEGQGTTNVAGAWNALPAIGKALYLRGLRDGADLASTAVITAYDDPQVRQDYFKVRADSLLSFQDVAKIRMKHLLRGVGDEMNVVITEMDRLYADPRNACIQIGLVANAALSLIDGWPERIVESQLAMLRPSGGCGE